MSFFGFNLVAKWLVVRLPSGKMNIYLVKTCAWSQPSKFTCGEDDMRKWQPWTSVSSLLGLISMPQPQTVIARKYSKLKASAFIVIYSRQTLRLYIMLLLNTSATNYTGGDSICVYLTN